MIGRAFKPEASCDLHKQDMLLDQHPLLFLQQYFLSTSQYCADFQISKKNIFLPVKFLPLKIHLIKKKKI